MNVDYSLVGVPDINTICGMICDDCTANDWYCPSDCDLLIKLKKMDRNKIFKKYVDSQGDTVAVAKYVKRAKV